MTSSPEPVLQTVATNGGRSNPARRIAWADPTHVTRSNPVWTHGLIALGVLALAVLDAYLMLPALESVLRLDPATTQKIAYGISAAATLAAAWIGWQVRGAAGNHPDSRAHLLLPGLVAAGWLALGLAIFLIRLVGTRSGPVVSYDAGTVGAGSGITLAQWTGSIMFLTFYVLVGALAAGDFYHLRQDAAAALRRASRRLDKASGELAEQEALLRRLIEVVQVRNLEVEMLPAQAAQAKTGNAHHAAELEQLSRHEQAVRLGSPSATGITSPEHEKNPINSAERSLP